MAKRENKSFGAAAAAIKKQKLETEANLKEEFHCPQNDRVKVNLSLIRKNQDRLKAEAKRRGLTVSALVSVWIEENCV